MIQPPIQPTHEEVIQQSQQGRRPNSIVCADITHDSDFGTERHVFVAQETLEEGRDDAHGPPVFDGVEEEFGAAVGVFFPWFVLVGWGSERGAVCVCWVMEGRGGKWAKTYIWQAHHTPSN